MIAFDWVVVLESLPGRMVRVLELTVVICWACLCEASVRLLGKISDGRWVYDVVWLTGGDIFSSSGLS